jgi:tetratricopeptide (TPR) repeat protein
MAGASQIFSDAATLRATFEASERAIALAPTLPEAHAARAHLEFFQGDLVAAISAARRALALAPGQHEARAVIGYALHQIGRADALRHLEAALAIDPTHEGLYPMLIWQHELHGDRERVAEVLEQARLRGISIGMRVEARLSLWRRDATRAAELLAECGGPSTLADDAWFRACLELVAHGKDPEIGPPAPPAGTLMPHLIRCFFQQMAVEVACFRSDHARALAGLARLDEDRSPDLVWLERVPLLEPLRAMPQFAAIHQSFRERAGRVVEAYLDQRS